MSLLSEIKSIIDELNIPVETGIFSNEPPSQYIVLTPLSDTYKLFADNKPGKDIEEIRISLFDKGNYKNTKKLIEQAILENDITITGRRYVTHEDGTSYHQIAIDIAKEYEI